MKKSLLILTLLTIGLVNTGSASVFELFVGGNTSPNGAVFRYDQTGANKPAIGQSGATYVVAGSNFLNSTQGLAVWTNGNLYVAGYNNAGIKTYAKDTGATVPGSFINGNFTPTDTDNTDSFNPANAVFIGPPPSSTAFIGARNVAFGPDGRLYATADGRARVIRFNGPDMTNPGHFVSFFTDPGGGTPNLDVTATGGPTDFHFDSDGNLLVVSLSNQRVKKFQGPGGATPGQFIGNATDAGGLDVPFGLALRYNGEIWVSDLGANGFTDGTDDSIKRFSSAGVLLNTYTSALLNQVRDIDFGPDGLLYIANQANNNVLRFDPATSAFSVFVTAGQGGLSAPTYLDFYSIPEPSTILLFAAGGWLLWRQRRMFFRK